MAATDLTPRSGRILTTVVREYIHTGEPVASVVIARRATLGISSATIRTVLARLEEQGFVRQPHTSAGRVPTDQGYRFYVQRLLEGRRLGEHAAVVDRIRQAAHEEPSLEALLSRVSHVLSDESRHVGFALATEADDQHLSRIEFVWLSASRVLVVAVAESGQVTQKVVDVGESLSPHDLRRAAELVNREYAGLSIEEVRTAIIARLQEARGVYDALMRRALEMARQTLEYRPRQALFVEGTATLFGEATHQPADLPLTTLGALVEMIEEKQRLVHLLNEYLDGPGLTVVIGAEHRLPDLRPFSLVAASYVDGRSVGSVGVIGPTRMHYSRAINVVESAARAIADAAGDSN